MSVCFDMNGCIPSGTRSKTTACVYILKKVEMQQQHIVSERPALIKEQGRETYLDATLVIVLQR